jgi:hypothetical protein
LSDQIVAKENFNDLSHKIELNNELLQLNIRVRNERKCEMDEVSKMYQNDRKMPDFQRKSGITFLSKNGQKHYKKPQKRLKNSVKPTADAVGLHI